MNWLALAPYLGILAALAFGGWEYTTVKERDARISSMQAQEAKNVAAAEKAVRDAAAKDAAKTDALVTQLQADNSALQKEAADARVSLATAPIVAVTPGCPDIMQSPVVGAFLRGLPN